MSAREVIVSGTLYESRSSFLTHCLAVPHDTNVAYSLPCRQKVSFSRTEQRRPRDTLNHSRGGVR